MKNKMTICELVDSTVRMLREREEYDVIVAANLMDIKKMAIRMENRLLKYCNAIEDLGFKRIGRDYDRAEPEC